MAASDWTDPAKDLLLGTFFQDAYAEIEGSEAALLAIQDDLNLKATAMADGGTYTPPTVLMPSHTDYTAGITN